MKIIIAKNYQTLSKFAASLVINQLRKKKNSVLGLPTGHTPLGLYLQLAKANQRGIISFAQAKTFNLDEYIGIKPDCRSSYHSYMEKNFFRLVDLQPKNIHLPNGAANNLEKECADYEKSINHNPIDLLILGIGRNGHIGFNEPGSNFNSKTRVVELSRSTRLANAKYFSDKNQAPFSAVTMGLATIMKAKKIVLLASGKDKAKAIQRTIKEKISSSVPASLLRKHKNLTIIVDQPAAKLL